MRRKVTSILITLFGIATILMCFFDKERALRMVALVLPFERLFLNIGIPGLNVLTLILILLFFGFVLRSTSETDKRSVSIDLKSPVVFLMVSTVVASFTPLIGVRSPFYSLHYEIIEMKPGESITALKNINTGEDYFKDHFPGFPVVPGVLLTEMMAQTAGKCLDAEKKTRGKAMLVQIKRANFKEWVLPGEVAFIYSQITTNTDMYATANSHIKVNKKKVCSAEFLFSFVPMKKLAPDYVDEVLENYLNS